MKFTKMQGIGNDYVYVDGSKERIADKPAMARRVSDRHFGVGSDGLICINPSSIADFEMEMYNADGSRGEMCGNGIRCVGKFVYDKGLTQKTKITIETLAGIKELELSVKEKTVETVKVAMGEPIFLPEQIPMAHLEELAGKEAVIGEPIVVDGVSYKMTAISMGNPHMVLFMDDIKALDLGTIGPGFEHHPMFPNRVNTEFVKVLDEHTVEMRVWERGSGETWACGTGACAVAVASILNGYTKEEVRVKLLGGDLDIYWDRKTNIVWMSGPATTVFEGELSEK